MAIQFDRLLTTALVDPALRAIRRLRASTGPQSVPVLMYHSITDDPEPGVGGYYRLNTPPSLFREHLRILKDEGFTVVDLATAFKGLNHSVNPETKANPDQRGRKLAVITFDDGFRDFLTAAWPALVEFGFTATVFLPTAFIGNDRLTFKTRECLTWEEVRELRKQGVSFGSHTINHPKLWELDPVTFATELRESRDCIERELGEPIHSFAHPYAFPGNHAAYIRCFRDTLLESGYSFGVTTSLGCIHCGDDALLLKRLPANGGDDASLFRAKLNGAYNWLAWPQKAVKLLKATRHSR